MQRRNKGQEMGREGIQLGWGVRKTQGLQAVLTTGEKKGGCEEHEEPKLKLTDPEQGIDV